MKNEIDFFNKKNFLFVDFYLLKCLGFCCEENKSQLYLLMYDDLSKTEDIKVLSESESSNMLKMYNMYEFSGNIGICMESNSYGSLYNYFKSGLLTMEEIIEIL